MDKLFADERDFLKSLKDMTPGQRGAAVETYVDNCKARLRDVSPQQLAEELRTPSTQINAVAASTINEALARIVLTCAI